MENYSVVILLLMNMLQKATVQLIYYKGSLQNSWFKQQIFMCLYSIYLPSECKLVYSSDRPLGLLNSCDTFMIEIIRNLSELSKIKTLLKSNQFLKALNPKCGGDGGVSILNTLKFCRQQYRIVNIKICFNFCSTLKYKSKLHKLKRNVQMFKHIYTDDGGSIPGFVQFKVI